MKALKVLEIQDFEGFFVISENIRKKHKRLENFSL
jgi:hypothetical protein